MRLTDVDLSEVPVAGHWLDRDGASVATTPEWRGAATETVQYRLGSTTLLVETASHDPKLDSLTDRFLAELDRSVADAHGSVRHRRALLRSGLRLVTGHPDITRGTTEDVFHALSGGLEVENVDLAIGPSIKGVPVDAPYTIALALKQLATNAWKHERCPQVTLRITDGPEFWLDWEGIGTSGEISTSRHPSRRTRWGLAMVRMAADALAATVVPSMRADGANRSASLFSLADSSQRFNLPLAAVDSDGLIERSTRAFDEETGRTPGSVVNDDMLILIRDALSNRGHVVSHDAFAARATKQRIWIALMPNSPRDQLRDLVAGIRHEEALADNDDGCTRLYGLASLIGLAIGEPTDMWFTDQLTSQLPAVCDAFGVALPEVVPNGHRSAPPAPLVAALCSEAHGGSVQCEDRVWSFHPRDVSSPVMSLLSNGGPIPLT